MSEHVAATEALPGVEIGLVSVSRWPDTAFIRLPMLYPGGSSVTVKIDTVGRDLYRVSDAGFGYQHSESVGAVRSYQRIARAMSADFCLAMDDRTIFVEAKASQLESAIVEVAGVSWRAVDRVYAKLSEGEEDEIVDYLTERLVAIFGRERVASQPKVIGASTSEWEVTATVNLGERYAVFQAVGSHANSVYRANAAFDDISALDRPPHIVAVVEDRAALGPKLTLLARSARIIERGQADGDFLRAAA